MATIIEKVVAGEDGAKSQEDFALATLAADKTQPSKEYLEAREQRAREEAEMNLTTNALIFPQPGETIATRVVEVPDEEATELKDGVRVVEQDAFVEALADAAHPNTGIVEGEHEEAVDREQPHEAGTPGTAKTSHMESSGTPGSGVGAREHHNS